MIYLKRYSCWQRQQRERKQSSFIGEDHFLVEQYSVVEYAQREFERSIDWIEEIIANKSTAERDKSNKVNQAYN